MISSLGEILAARDSNKKKRAVEMTRDVEGVRFLSGQLQTMRPSMNQAEGVLLQLARERGRELKEREQRERVCVCMCRWESKERV